MKNKNNYYKVLCFTSMLFCTFSCKKLVEVKAPQNELSGSIVFSSDITATAALLGIYTQMSSGQFSMSFMNAYYNGMSADELVSYSTPVSNFYINTLNPMSDLFWATLYKFIFQANLIIEGVANPTITLAAKQQLTGEALFIRAFCHFYLVNLFGDVPYLKTSDYRVNNLASRMPVADVYGDIISDLKEAQNLISDDYLDVYNKPSAEKVRPNKAAVAAMLARVYLYKQDWANAALQASAVIDNPNYNLSADLNDVFLMNSDEAIWQFMSGEAYPNTVEGNGFILKRPPTSVGYKVALSDQVWNAFEPGDKRKTDWVGSYTEGSSTWHYPFKYKISSIGDPTEEYTMVLRLTEQYLIRAEARVHQNNISEAVEDINIIRARARTLSTDLPDIPATISQSDCLLAIEHERQVEFFVEWGNRWYDLKRTGRADAVLAPVKGVNWQSTDVLYPIPQAQLDSDPNMTGHQNPGYQ